MNTTVLADFAAIARNSIRMRSELFDPSLPETAARRLFSEYVELVEIETTSYCNRTCSFCPNQFIDRRSQSHPMPEACWETIVHDLKAVDYRGTVVWSRYSEPLSEPRFVERVRQLKAAAPSCRVGVNTNGDYLDQEYLDRLAQAGLDRMWIDVYLPDADVYDTDSAYEYLDKLRVRLGNPAILISTETPEVAGRIKHSSIEITVHCRNSASMQSHMSDRAGLLTLTRRGPRTAPCFAPFKHLVIDWDGSVVVCCQMRSDAGSHAAGVIGTIGRDLSLIQAFVRLAPWRASLRDYGEKSAPCSTCNLSEYQAVPLLLTASKLLGGDTVVHRAARTLLDPLVGFRPRY